jgi:hypothetical protein
MAHGLIGFIGYYCLQRIIHLPETRREEKKKLSVLD